MKLLVKNVEKKFGENKVLKGINFEFEKGKIYGLLGRNGAGKSTFFNCINSDLDYTGEILLQDEENKTRVPDSNDIGYCVSEPVVPEFLTGREFLKFFLEINGDRVRNKKTIEEYFDMMNIDHKDMNKLLKDYSLGMKNKMQMLVNIILDSELLLLDEPLTSLDVVVAEEMKNLFKSLKKDHILIFSTHIMELALDLCDEIVILSNGVLTKVEKKNMNKDYIIKFLKGDNDVQEPTDNS
jgi:ABC-2 type transport system ATP-binding protein